MNQGGKLLFEPCCPRIRIARRRANAQQRELRYGSLRSFVHRDYLVWIRIAKSVDLPLREVLDVVEVGLALPRLLHVSDLIFYKPGLRSVLHVSVVRSVNDY